MSFDVTHAPATDKPIVEAQPHSARMREHSVQTLETAEHNIRELEEQLHDNRGTAAACRSAIEQLDSFQG